MEDKLYSFPRPENFSIAQIFDCGQCFRFDPAPDGSGDFEGVAYGTYLRISEKNDNITIYGIGKDDFDKRWKHFFALDCDYSDVRSSILSAFGDDETISLAMDSGKGIRILRQEPWEAVCSFIISQNNNIPRIKKIIEALCEKYGEPISTGVKTYYSFPTPQALCNAGEENIFALKTGFRASYIFDAAKRFSLHEFDDLCDFDGTTDDLLKRLMTIRGIGPKVASCAALFGYGRTDAFPVDVWVKRVLEKYYPSGLDISSLGKYAGIAQQYLFYYERYKTQKL